VGRSSPFADWRAGGMWCSRWSLYWYVTQDGKKSDGFVRKLFHLLLLLLLLLLLRAVMAMMLV
jgi:hypothetical protein